MNALRSRWRLQRRRAQLAATCMLGLAGIAPGQAAQAKEAAEAKVLWKYAPNKANFEGVVVRDGIAFALDRSGTIHAIDAASGERRWQSGKLPLDFGYGLALTTGPGLDAIVVGCDTGLFAFDRATGKQLWSTTIVGGVAGPVCTDTAVFAGGADGNVYACDLKTGHTLWQHNYMEDRPDDPPGFAGAQARFDGRPARPGQAATDGKIVVLPIFDQCRAIAVDAATGKRRWDVRTEGWMLGAPAFGMLNVFVGSQDDHFYAVDRDTGKLAWKLATGARIEASSAPADRFVYFGSCDGNLYAVDQTVDHVVWKFATELDADGGAPIYSRPLVRGDTVYLAAMKGKIYAVDRKAGTLRWKLEPLADSELNSSELAAEGDLLFVTTRKGQKGGESVVVAIKLP